MKEEYRHHSCGRVAGGIIGGVFIAAAFALVFGALAMVLWNWLMPVIFGLGVIGYWQGFGLVLLTKLLFGGLGHGWMRHDKNRGPGAYWHGRRKYWDGHARRAARNGHFDDVYEDWWEKEGSASFDEFMKRKESDKASKGEEKKDEEKKDEEKKGE